MIRSNISPGVAIDSNGHAISYVTMAETVKYRNDKNLNEVLDAAFKEGIGQKRVNNFLNKIDNAIVLFFDDASKIHYKNYKELLSNKGFSSTMCLRMDYINDEFTYDNLIEMQQDGQEICYHGYSHAFDQSNIEADLESFKANIIDEIEIYGCATPNALAPADSFKDEFIYIRQGGLNGVSNVASTNLQEGFGLVTTCFIDDLTSDENLTILENSITTLFTNVHNKTLTLSIHLDNNNLPYLKLFLNWCESNGIKVLSAKQAHEQYVMKFGGMDSNANVFNILDGTETNNYFIIAGNGKVRTNQF